MGEIVIPVRSTVCFTAASAFLLAIASAILGYSGSFAQDVLAGLIVGALTGFLTCAALCGLRNNLLSAEVRHSRAATVTNTIIGGYVGMLVTSILVMIAVTIVGSLNHLPNPLLWGALITSLGGWVVGGLLGVMIGATWSEA